VFDLISSNHRKSLFCIWTTYGHAPCSRMCMGEQRHTAKNEHCVSSDCLMPSIALFLATQRSQDFKTLEI